MALLTTIVSIPILVILHYVLHGYASNWPGSRGTQDDIGKVYMSGAEEGEGSDRFISAAATATSSATEMACRDSASGSAFGIELKKALPTDSATDYHTAGMMAQIAYAGMYCTLV